MDTGKKFAAIRKALHLNQAEFAEPLGVGFKQISAIENGRVQPSSSVMELLFLKYLVNRLWWDTGEGEMFTDAKQKESTEDFLDKMRSMMAKQPQPPADYVTIPRYYVAASAGGGTTVYSEQIVDHLTFKTNWLKGTLGLSPERVAVISVKGDSMEPCLYNGDLIMVDLSVSRVESNAVYVLQLGGLLMVKRVQVKMDGEVIVKSDNSRYEPESFRGESAERLVVIGRMVKRLVD